MAIVKLVGDKKEAAKFKPWALNKLRELTNTRLELGLTALANNYNIRSGTKIYIDSNEFGDKIRIADTKKNSGYVYDNTWIYGGAQDFNPKVLPTPIAGFLPNNIDTETTTFGQSVLFGSMTRNDDISGLTEQQIIDYADYINQTNGAYSIRRSTVNASAFENAFDTCMEDKDDKKLSRLTSYAFFHSSVRFQYNDRPLGTPETPYSYIFEVLDVGVDSVIGEYVVIAMHDVDHTGMLVLIPKSTYLYANTFNGRYQDSVGIVSYFKIDSMSYIDTSEEGEVKSKSGAYILETYDTALIIQSSFDPPVDHNDETEITQNYYVSGYDANPLNYNTTGRMAASLYSSPPPAPINHDEVTFYSMGAFSNTYMDLPSVYKGGIVYGVSYDLYRTESNLVDTLTTSNKSSLSVQLSNDQLRVSRPSTIGYAIKTNEKPTVASTLMVAENAQESQMYAQRTYTDSTPNEYSGSASGSYSNYFGLDTSTIGTTVFSVNTNAADPYYHASVNVWYPEYFNADYNGANVNQRANRWASTFNESYKIKDPYNAAIFSVYNYTHFGGDNTSYVRYRWNAGSDQWKSPPTVVRHWLLTSAYHSTFPIPPETKANYSYNFSHDEAYLNTSHVVTDNYGVNPNIYHTGNHNYTFGKGARWEMEETYHCLGTPVMRTDTRTESISFFDANTGVWGEKVKLNAYVDNVEIGFIHANNDLQDAVLRSRSTGLGAGFGESTIFNTTPRPNPTETGLAWMSVISSASSEYYNYEVDTTYENEEEITGYRHEFYPSSSMNSTTHTGYMTVGETTVSGTDIKRSQVCEKALSRLSYASDYTNTLLYRQMTSTFLGNSTAGAGAYEFVFWFYKKKNSGRVYRFIALVPKLLIWAIDVDQEFIDTESTLSVHEAYVIDNVRVIHNDFISVADFLRIIFFCGSVNSSGSTYLEIVQ